MAKDVTFIGFGEAAQSFAGDAEWCGSARAFDIKTTHTGQAAAKHADYRRFAVQGEVALADALSPASLVISVVTADQALAVAREAAGLIGPGTLYCDFNSVAPETKRAAAQAIIAEGGCYCDVAVMAPVSKALATPLLLSGPEAGRAETVLRALGFSNVRMAGGEIGRASAIKMIRSVMVKGMEALTAECVLAADVAGVLDDVLASLGGEWESQANYNLDRMLVHGIRRAAEMEQVAETLVSLGISPDMTAGTIKRQRELGALEMASPPKSLRDKLTALRNPAKVSVA